MKIDMTANQRSKTMFRFLVDAKFQFKYTAMLVFLTALMSAVFGYFYYQNEMSKTQMLLILDGELKDMLLQSDKKAIYIFGLFVMVQSFFLALLGLFFTHKVAGPLRRVQNHIEEYLNSQEIKTFFGVRQNDDFQSFFSSFEKYSKLFNQKHQSNQKLISFLKSVSQNEVSNVQKNAKDLLDEIEKN